MEGTILVVDADADVRDMLTLALEADGYRAAGAPGARAALNYLRSSDTICVVLNAGSKAVDAAGFRAAQRRDRALAWIPVVIMSSEPDADIVARRLGAAALLRTPFRLDDLRQAVAGAVGRPRRAAR